MNKINTVSYNTVQAHPHTDEMAYVLGQSVTKLNDGNKFHHCVA